MKKIISDEKNESKKDTEMTANGDSQQRASMRGQLSTSRIHVKLCMLCKKKDKYKKGSKTRENLTQARQLHTDKSVRNSEELLMQKNGTSQNELVHCNATEVVYTVKTIA